MSLTLFLSGCSGNRESSQTEEKKENTEEQTKTVDGFLDWTKVDSAQEAAREAGFKEFGVFDRITLDEMDFKDPTFAYREDVAQATYEQPACAVYLRKAEGSHKEDLTDRDVDEFAEKWTLPVDELDVTLYGQVKGEATYFTWKDGKKEYGVTYQGLGGEEMNMDEDEVTFIVQSVQAADNKESVQIPTAQPDAGQTVVNQADMIPEAQAIATVGNAGGVNVLGITKVFTQSHGWCWLITARDANGNINSYYVDSAGMAYVVPINNGSQSAPEQNNQGQSDSSQNNQNQNTQPDSYNPWGMQADQAIAIVQNATGYQARSWQLVQTANYGWCWLVSTVDGDGNIYDYYVDNSGNTHVVEYE